MSTTRKVTPPPPTPTISALPGPQVPDHLIAWPEVAAALFAAKGITKGWWRIGMQLRFGALTTRMGEPGQEQKSLPTAIVGIDSIAIFATTQGGEMVYDAGNGCAPVPTGAVAAPASSGKATASKPARKKAPPPSREPLVRR